MTEEKYGGQGKRSKELCILARNLTNGINSFERLKSTDYQIIFYTLKPIPTFLFVLSLCEIAFGGLSYDDEQKLDESVHQRNFEIKVEAKDQEGKVLRWT